MNETKSSTTMPTRSHNQAFGRFQYPTPSLARGRGGIHELLDIETARATADTLTTLHDDLAAGTGISGPAARRAIHAAAQAPAFAGSIRTHCQARDILGNPALAVHDNPQAFLMCVYNRDRALCHRLDMADTPRLDRCQPSCANVARTDQHADQLLWQAMSLEKQAASEALPGPLADRLSQRRTAARPGRPSPSRPPPHSGADLMSPAPDERERIRAAMDRILSGTPEHSNGALTIVALAVEAGVPRNALTQRHTDLKNEFYEKVRARGATPDGEQRLRKQVRRRGGNRPAQGRRRGTGGRSAPNRVFEIKRWARSCGAGAVIREDVTPAAEVSHSRERRPHRPASAKSRTAQLRRPTKPRWRTVACAINWRIVLRWSARSRRRRLSPSSGQA
jgi:hypothetical protein